MATPGLKTTGGVHGGLLDENRHHPKHRSHFMYVLDFFLFPNGSLRAPAVLVHGRVQVPGRSNAREVFRVIRTNDDEPAAAALEPGVCARPFQRQRKSNNAAQKKRV